MYKKPSLEEVKAFFHSTQATLQTRWRVFQTHKHSRNEWFFIFAIAFVFGMATKTIAIKTFTIGYEDYLVSKTTPQIHTLEKPVISKGPICEE